VLPLSELVGSVLVARLESDRGHLLQVGGLARVAAADRKALSRSVLLTGLLVGVGPEAVEATHGVGLREGLRVEDHDRLAPKPAERNRGEVPRPTLDQARRVDVLLNQPVNADRLLRVGDPHDHDLTGVSLEEQIDVAEDLVRRVAVSTHVQVVAVVAPRDPALGVDAEVEGAGASLELSADVVVLTDRVGLVPAAPLVGGVTTYSVREASVVARRERDVS